MTPDNTPTCPILEIVNMNQCKNPFFHYLVIKYNSPIDKQTEGKKGFDKFKEQVATMYDKTTESAKHTLASLNNKIKETHIGDDLKKFGSKVADKSKEYGVN